MRLFSQVGRKGLGGNIVEKSVAMARQEKNAR